MSTNEALRLVTDGAMLALYSWLAVAYFRRDPVWQVMLACVCLMVLITVGDLVTFTERMLAAT